MAADELSQLRTENLRLKRAVSELGMLNDLARELGSSLDSEKIIERLVRRSIKAVQASQGVVTLVDESSSTSMKTLYRAATDSGGRTPFHLDDHVLGWMQINRKPLMLNDPTNDSRFRGVRWDSLVVRLLAAPLMVKSSLIGVLAVYNKRNNTDFTEDDQRLLAIIAAQSAQIVETARLYTEERALTRVREEMRLAYDIQTELQLKTFPSIVGYDLAGLTVPAQTVGGDYLDVFTLGEHEHGLCVADVSGKGLPASLLMANVQATIRGQATWTDSADECLRRANKLLCESVRRGSFVTLYFAILNDKTHRVRYSNAGHNRPYLVQGDGSVRMLEHGGIVLGVMPGFNYMQEHVDLPPESALVIYSDGVTEAMNPRREQFGEERLETILSDVPGKSAQDVTQTILNAVREFCEGTEQSDDITLLVVQRQ